MRSTWVDCHGDFSLTNVTTGARCALHFTPCGWFSAGRYEVRAPLPHPLLLLGGTLHHWVPHFSASFF